MLAYLLLLISFLVLMFGATNLYDLCFSKKQRVCTRNMQMLQNLASFGVALAGIAGAYRYAVRPGRG